MRKNLYVLFAAFVLASLVLAACLSPSGGGGAATEAPAAPIEEAMAAKLPIQWRCMLHTL